MKKLVWIILSILILPAFVTSETSYHSLTRGWADTLYCKIGGDCSLNNLNVANLTVNTTVMLNVTEYNVSGDMYVNGTIFANDWTNVTITESQITDLDHFSGSYLDLDDIPGNVFTYCQQQDWNDSSVCEQTTNYSVYIYNDTSELSRNIQFNYTVPENASRYSRVEIFLGNYQGNVTLPSACWNDTVIKFNARFWRETAGSLPTTDIYCYNGTDENEWFGDAYHIYGNSSSQDDTGQHNLAVNDLIFDNDLTTGATLTNVAAPYYLDGCTQSANQGACLYEIYMQWTFAYDINDDINDIWVNETGDTMTGDLNLSGNILYEVENITITNDDIFYGNNIDYTPHPVKPDLLDTVFMIGNILSANISGINIGLNNHIGESGVAIGGGINCSDFNSFCVGEQLEDAHLYDSYYSDFMLGQTIYNEGDGNLGIGSIISFWYNSSSNIMIGRSSFVGDDTNFSISIGNYNLNISGNYSTNIGYWNQIENDDTMLFGHHLNTTADDCLIFGKYDTCNETNAVIFGYDKYVSRSPMNLSPGGTKMLSLDDNVNESRFYSPICFGETGDCFDSVASINTTTDDWVNITGDQMSGPLSVRINDDEAFLVEYTGGSDIFRVKTTSPTSIDMWENLDMHSYNIVDGGWIYAGRYYLAGEGILSWDDVNQSDTWNSTEDFADDFVNITGDTMTGNLGIASVNITFTDEGEKVEMYLDGNNEEFVIHYI